MGRSNKKGWFWVRASFLGLVGFLVVFIGLSIEVQEKGEWLFKFGAEETKSFLVSIGFALSSSVFVFVVVERILSRITTKEMQEQIRDVLFESQTIERFYPGGAEYNRSRIHWLYSKRGRCCVFMVKLMPLSQRQSVVC